MKKSFSKRVMLLVVGIYVTTIISGCATLIIRDSDSIGIKAAKITTRSILFVYTLTWSEYHFMSKAKKKETRRQFYEFWEENVGIITIDQVVQQMGVPTSRYDSDKLIIAEWNSLTTSYRYYSYFGQEGISPVGSGWQLILSFDKNTKRLSTWKHREW